MSELIGVIVALLFMLLSVAAWVTHVITCIETQQWIFLIAGAIAAPIGIIHGFGVWIGVW